MVGSGNYECLRLGVKAWESPRSSQQEDPLLLQEPGLSRAHGLHGLLPCCPLPEWVNGLPHG